jgi:Icc-related predicted phosphoesterase
MAHESDGRPAPGAEQTIRIAAAGDIHCREARRAEVEAAFASLEQVDLVLLAGDLTTYGEPEEAAVLVDACRRVDAPVYGVLGNHDHHAGRADELVALLTKGGVTLLDRSCAVEDVHGCEVGIVGAKGFVGGFPGSHLTDFGEPLLREVYAETTAEVEAIDGGLREVAHCPFRIVLLHYSPTADTLEGEPPGIWAFLGADRLAAPILEHEPDIVLHGHAHAGRFEGAIGQVAVYNVSVPVMGRDFWRFDLSTLRRPTTPIH